MKKTRVNKPPILPQTVMENAIDSASCGVIITNTEQSDNPIIYVNSHFEQLTGYSRAEVMGRNCRFLQQKDRNQSPLDIIRKAIQKGQRASGVLRNYKNDGTLFYNSLTVSPLKSKAGKTTHFVGIAKDVTDQVKMEQKLVELISAKEDRFAAYMANASEVIWRLDFSPPISLKAPPSQQVNAFFNNAIITEANDPLAKLYGHKVGKEVIGKPLKNFTSLSDPQFRKGVENLIRNKYKTTHELTHGQAPDGRDWYTLNNTMPHIRGNRIFHMWGTSFDVTELINTQNELKKSKKELTQKNMALKELIGQIEYEKEELKKRIMANVERVVLPSLDKLKVSGENKEIINQHRQSITDLTSSFGRKVSEVQVKLTPRELEISNFIKNGLTNKEIAKLLNIAPHTVEKHRLRARKKLGLTKKHINLNTYLNTN